MDAARPLIYACSGCSNLAQLTNALALQADRAGYAEMSCISGVGGGVAPLVRLAQSGRPVVALDGCALQCVVACLARAEVQPVQRMVMTQLGLRKRAGIDFDPADLARIEPAVRRACEAAAAGCRDEAV